MSKYVDGQADRRKKVKALWHEGKSCNEIAKLIDSNPATVMRDCRAMDLPLNKKERDTLQPPPQTEWPDDDPESKLWNLALYSFKPSACRVNK